MTRQLTSKFLEVRGGAVCGCVLALVLSWWGFAEVARAATLTAPTISGAPQEGVTLAAIPGTPGPVGDTFDAPTYQWLVCSTPTSCTNGPTTATFLLSASEVGKTIEVAETVNDTSATPPAPVTTTSTPTTAVLPAVPTPAAGLPSVLGAAVQNGTLSVVHGGWNGSPTTYTDTWYRCAVTCAATGIVGSTYVLGLADIGSTIEVVETATNLGGASTASETSAQTAAAVVGIPVNTVPPAITGTPQQGQVLTLTPGTWSNAPTLGDVWEDCTAPTLCSAIPGATGLTYTVGAGDVGHTIAVQETASNLAAPGGIKAPLITTGTASATSATSVVVFSQNSPNTNEAVTLVATVSSSSGNANPHGSLSFFNGSNAISGCANKGVSGGQTITIVCQASFGAGQAQVSAAYLADPTTLVAGSTSTTTSVDIGKGSTSMSLAVTPKVAPGGQATYVATLGVPLSSAGPVLPSGSIQFLDGGQPISGCTNQALSNLTATCSVSYPSAGQHSISARYDGDSNFTGAASSASGVQVVKGAPKKPTVRAALGSTLGWTIYYRRHYSWVGALTAFAVPKGTTILVQCFGKGCPFAKWRITKAAGTVNLMPHFHHHHLRAGVRITVRLTRKNWIGKYYSFSIRAGHKPKIQKTCLAPGKVQAAVACPAT